MKTHLKAMGWRLFPQYFTQKHLATTPGAEIEEVIVPVFLNQSSECIDVGANRGRYTILMSRLARQVHAFDPNPSCVEILQQLGLPNVSIYPHALYSCDGLTDYFVPVQNGQQFSIWGSLESSVAASHAEVKSLQVSRTTLDSMCDRPIRFIKIDVEGHELEVLQGGRQLMTNQQPICMIEAEERHSPQAIQNVNSFFQAYGYQGFFILDRCVLPLKQFDQTYQNPTELQRAVPRVEMRYVNNFIFIPETANVKVLCQQMQDKLNALSPISKVAPAPQTIVNLADQVNA